MPDISMCGRNDCPLMASCYRNPASGTLPSGFRQSWMMFEKGPWSIDEAGKASCDHYWPVVGRSQRRRLDITTAVAP